MEELREYEREGLLEISPQWIEVTPRAAWLIRNICHGYSTNTCAPARSMRLFQGDLTGSAGILPACRQDARAPL